MKHTLHRYAAAVSALLIASFWSATVVSGLFLTASAMTAVKQAIVCALFVLVPALMATGASGFALAGKRQAPLLQAKRRRMPFIALNGLLVLVPAALFLNARAQLGLFDSGYYAVQGIELLAGAINLVLIGLNACDGRRLRVERQARMRQAPANGAQ